MNTKTKQIPTLRELIDMTLPTSLTVKTPTSAALIKSEKEPIQEISGLRVYRNGFAFYENASGHSVFRIDSCRHFTFSFQPAPVGQNSSVPSSCTIPVAIMENLPWYIPLTLVGDCRVEQNKIIHRKEYSLESLLNESTNTFISSDEAFSGSNQNENPETALIRKETSLEMLNTLTERQRQVFLLYYMGGLTQYEIAERLGIARTAVSRILRRSTERIKKKRDPIQ